MQRLQNTILRRTFTLIIISAVVMTVAGILITIKQMHADLRLRLNDGAEGILEDIDADKNRLTAQVQHIAEHDNLAQAIMARDANTIISVLAAHAKEWKLEVFEAIDAQGRILPGGFDPSREGMDVSDDMIFRRAFNGEHVCEVGKGRFGIGVVAARPFERDGRVVGVIRVEYPFNTDVVDQWQRQYGLDATVYDGRILQTTSFNRGNPAQDRDLRNMADHVTASEKPVCRQTMVADRSYCVLSRNLLPGSQHAAGTLLLATPCNAVGEIVFYFAVISIAISLLLLFLCYIACERLACDIVRPIEEISSVAGAVADGDLTRKAEIDTPNEIGRLGEVFNKMVARLSETTISIRALETEIAERKKAEKALQDSLEQLHAAELRYRRIVEDQTEFIVRWRPDGTRTFVNESYCRYFGITYEEAINTSFFSLIPEADHQLVLDRLNALTPDNPISSGEHRVMLPGGRTGWNYWTDRAIFDKKGSIIECQSIGRDITDQKEAELALQESHDRILRNQEELRLLATELARAEERERKTVAAALHDSIGQNLVSSRIIIEQAAKNMTDEFARNSLQKVSNILNSVIEETQELTADLGSPTFYQFGLAAAIQEWLTDEIEQQHNINAAFMETGQTPHLPEELGIFIFRAVRELLHNVVKHAEASRVRVQLQTLNGHIVVEVTDDGKGFDRDSRRADRRKGGFGLFNIQERCKYLKGDCLIDSAPGRGTHIRLQIPLPRNIVPVEV